VLRFGFTIEFKSLTFYLERMSPRSYLATLDAPSGELLLIAASAVDLLFPGNEALGTNGSLTHAAAETLLVPLAGLVLHLFVAWGKDKESWVIQRRI